MTNTVGRILNMSQIICSHAHNRSKRSVSSDMTTAQLTTYPISMSAHGRHLLHFD